MVDVAVVGVGQTKFGELWGSSLRQLGVEAFNGALSDAGIGREAIQALYVGCMASGYMTAQEHLAALFADHCGITPKHAVRCEAACASGGVALRQAWLAIKSGVYDVVAVLGVEKMTDVGASTAMRGLMAAGDAEWEGSIGLTFAGLYALMARAHMHAFGTTREQMALVSVNNHRNAVKNPYAQFRNEITLQDVLNANIVADPLGLLDCSPLSDGAACVILASESAAKRFEQPVWVIGSSQGSASLALAERTSLVEMPATRAAVAEVWKQTGLDTKDIDVLEVHDCFSINEIIALEDLGFCPKGQGGLFVERGCIGLGGDIPTNTSGGLKAIGHPVGASGVRQVIDVVRQIRGCAPNQVGGASTGLCLNIGGVGGTAVVHILSSERHP
ncbi:MAG: thiolase domain-containing protein [Candidatus Aenigmatarchaeota archaeon]